MNYQSKSRLCGNIVAYQHRHPLVDIKVIGFAIIALMALTPGWAAFRSLNCRSKSTSSCPENFLCIAVAEVAPNNRPLTVVSTRIPKIGMLLRETLRLGPTDRLDARGRLFMRDSQSAVL
jgi:hypothetical protein